MRTYRKAQPPVQQQCTILEFVGPDTKTRKRSVDFAISPGSFAKATAEVEAAVKSGEWDGMGVDHAMALYCRLHRHIYRVEAADAIADWKRATPLIQKRLDTAFKSDMKQLVQFIKWAFGRQQARDETRTRNGLDPTPRLVWRSVFVTNWLLTDYRMFLARAQR